MILVGMPEVKRW